MGNATRKCADWQGWQGRCGRLFADWPVLSQWKLRCFSPQRVSGVGGLLQKRLEDLEAMVRRLEEERTDLKQDNAVLVSCN